MRYSSGFTRDFEFYLRMRNTFTFSGSALVEVEHAPNGASCKQAFKRFDSEGLLVPTKHPIALQRLINTKKSVNLHVKMYAEGRAEGTFPRGEFDQFATSINAPEWFSSAVENQARRISTN